MSRRIANRAAEKGPSATQTYVHVGVPSTARSWLFELRGEATRRGLRQRIYSALVSRPTAAAQLEGRGAALPLDLFEPPVAVSECQRVATGAEVYSQRPFSARRRRTRSCGRSATRERRGSRGVTSRMWRPDSHVARSVPEVQKESAASGKVAPIPSTLRRASTSTGRCPE